jgi:competence protein ComEA
MRPTTWLYRLQQRLSITTHEGLAILTLLGLFLLGLTVQHVREQQTPPLAVDSLVARSSAQEDVPKSAAAGPTPQDPIPLNQASVQKLQALNGIGPALAERIVEYRATQRPFQRPAELKRVQGIGPKTLADLRPVVTVAASEE